MESHDPNHNYKGFSQMSSFLGELLQMGVGNEKVKIFMDPLSRTCSRLVLSLQTISLKPSRLPTLLPILKCWRECSDLC